MTINITAAPTPFSSQNIELLKGHMIETGADAGNATLDEPVLCSASVIDTLFGKKSMLAAMYKAAVANAPLQEIWALPIAAVGVAMNATITVQNASTNLGQCIFYIAGHRHSIVITEGDSNNDVAIKIVAAINGSTIVVSAVALQNVITITCVHKGDLKLSLVHVYNGDEGDIGKNTLILTAFLGGNGQPDIGTALANLADDEYDYIASGFSGTTVLDQMQSFLDHKSGRWSADKQIYGHYITAVGGTLGELSAIGVVRNDAHTTIMDMYDSISPAWEWAAALGAVIADHMASAPELSRPLQTLVLKNIRAPNKGRTTTERNTLLWDGIATHKKTKSGVVTIERAITTYQRTANDIPDASWLDINTLAQNAYFARFTRAHILAIFPRSALADTNPRNLAEIATPDDIRKECIQAYMSLIDLGVCENLSGFEKLLTVSRSKVDANRIEINWGTDFVNQLMVIAANAKSYLQIENGVV